MPLENLNNSLEVYKKGLVSGRPIFGLQREWTKSIDSEVASLFKASCRGETSIAVFALGGYGRGEMSPFSDVDLMFLCEDRAASNVVDGILYPFWNNKFEAGGATRTLKDCSLMFQGDIRAQTAMLDARFIVGSERLAEGFFDLIKDRLNDKRWIKFFLRRKYYEDKARLKKFGGSVYMLEPHIKESRGGLREYHAIRWFERALKISIHDQELLKYAEFLFKIRCWLHFISGKKDDRLTFENQRLVADVLNIRPSQLMNDYYKSTLAIHKKSREIITKAAPLLEKLVRRWREERLKKIAGDLPSWPRIASNPDVIFYLLSRLHDTGDIKRLFPSFETIYCKSQFGAYHVYTIDVHSIFTVRKVVELKNKLSPKELRKAYKRVKNKDILFLAALLHDVGKGVSGGGDHIKSGAKIAKEEATRLGYQQKDAEKVAFLVRSHLIMPRLAFSRDLADPLLVENFASSIEDIELLDMLFVLAYADIASIGPDVWNSWKEKLLTELYLLARKYLEGEKLTHVNKMVEKMRRSFLKLKDDIASEWLSIMTERYFVANTETDIGAHIEMYKEYIVLKELSGAVLVRHRIAGPFSEFLVMTEDSPGLFLKIAGIMAANNVNILSAELNTSRKGTILDTLRVQNEIGRPVTNQMAVKIEAQLKEVLTGRKDIKDVARVKVSDIWEKGPVVEPKVEVDNDVSVYYTVIDIMAKDRMGLLYDLSRVLLEHNCTIDLAKIITKANAAVDAFYVRNLDGTKVSKADKVAALKKDILTICGQ